MRSLCGSIFLQHEMEVTVQLNLKTRVWLTATHPWQCATNATEKALEVPSSSQHLNYPRATEKEPDLNILAPSFI